MADTHKTPKYWTCGCDPTTGFHIMDALYCACVYCGKSRYHLKEIVVPSGMGGVFAVDILDVTETHATVQVVNSVSEFDSMPPFSVPLKDVAPRWMHTAGEAQ